MFPLETSGTRGRTRQSGTKTRKWFKKGLPSFQAAIRGCLTHRQYSEKLLDHYRHPRNVGSLPEADAVVTVGNPGHGDVLQLSLKFLEGRVIDARFKSFGCAVAIAAGSVATDLIRGLRLEELETIGNVQVAAALGGVPENKVECSVLVEQALREIVGQYRTRISEQNSMETVNEPYRGNAASAAGASPRG